MKRATTLAGAPGFGGPAHPRCFSRLFVVPPCCKTAFWRAGARQGSDFAVCSLRLHPPVAPCRPEKDAFRGPRFKGVILKENR